MSNSSQSRPKIFVSKPMKLRQKELENRFYRADLEFHDLDHAGVSYEARIFLNKPDADHKTEPTVENGYAGSINVFGHGGCFGDVGHCDVPMEKRSYDNRPSHPLTPLYKRVRITEALRKEIGNHKDEVTVTVVPFVKGGEPEMCDMENVLKFRRLSIVTYDK